MRWQPNRKYVRSGVQVKLGEQAAAKEGEEGSGDKAGAGAASIQNPFEYDISSMEDKPWRLPGAALMTGAAFAYGIGGDDPWSKAFLHGIAAGAVGLIVMVMVQLGSRVLKSVADYVFVIATAPAVTVFGVQVPYALLVAGAVAIWWHRPRDRSSK